MARFPLILLPLPLLLGGCAGDSTTGTSKNDPASEKEQVQWTSAENLKNSGDLVGAAKIYEELARKNTSSVDAEIALAAIDRKLGKPADAVAVMQDAQKRQPDNQAVASQLGYALIDAGRPEEAVAVFEGIIRQDPGNALAYSGKGVAFDKSGNHLAAQEIYQQALKIAPDTLSIENNLAMSLILNNQLDHAITILNKLSTHYPDNKTVRHNLALAYGLKGDNTKALQLNMKDLTPEQAKENEKFYKYYSHMREKLAASDTSEMQIGFSETPDDEKTATHVKPKHKPAAPKTPAATEDTKPVTPAPAEATKSTDATTPAAVPVKEEIKPLVPATAATSPAEDTKPDSDKTPIGLTTVPDVLPRIDTPPTSADDAYGTTTPKVKHKSAASKTPPPPVAQPQDLPEPTKAKTPDADTAAPATPASTDPAQPDASQSGTSLITPPGISGTALPTTSDDTTSDSDFPTQHRR